MLIVKGRTAVFLLFAYLAFGSIIDASELAAAVYADVSITQIRSQFERVYMNPDKPTLQHP